MIRKPFAGSRSVKQKTANVPGSVSPTRLPREGGNLRWLEGASCKPSLVPGRRTGIPQGLTTQRLSFGGPVRCGYARFLDIAAPVVAGGELAGASAFP